MKLALACGAALLCASAGATFMWWFAPPPGVTAAQFQAEMKRLRNACGAVPRMQPAPYRIVA